MISCFNPVVDILIQKYKVGYFVMVAAVEDTKLSNLQQV